MTKSIITTYSVLLLFTFLTALLSLYVAVSTVLVLLILGIASVKFLLVAFQFMELKKANLFWKASVAMTLLLLVLVLIFLKNNS